VDSTGIDRAVAIDHLTKRYGDLTAVDDVNIAVAPGEVYGLLGPNGSGKSTTIRVLLGYLAPTAGTVAVLGDDARLPSTRARIGYLPGDLRLPMRLTGQRILDFTVATLRAAGRDVPDTEVSDLAARLELDLTRRFTTLSKGNRQKIGILRALLGSPDVLVLDEPTSGLDPLVQDLVLDLVRARAEAGAAVLFSSHILSEVESIADRVGVLNRGRLVTEGSVAELVASAPQQLVITLTTPVTTESLLGVPGVDSIQIEDRDVHLAVTGSAAEVFTRLAPYGIERVKSAGNELDEVFHRSVTPAWQEGAP
jgi:ABC-2 type transport system ATP-binding protein